MKGYGQIAMDALEHFNWARERALEYVELGDGGGAMASLVSDLNKHPGTARILTPDLQYLFAGEVVIGGAAGAKQFIEGIPVPAVDQEGGVTNR
jgi:hypothetical protein